MYSKRQPRVHFVRKTITPSNSDNDMSTVNSSTGNGSLHTYKIKLP